MLDILDRDGKVVAVVMDDGTIVKKTKVTDDINQLVKDQLEKANKKRKR